MDIRDNNTATLRGERHNRCHHVAASDAHRADDLVATTTPCFRHDQLKCLFNRSRRMRRTKLLCRLTLEFNRVNGEDALSSSELCAHNCCRTKSTDTNNGDVVTGLHFSRIDRRSPTSGGATAKEHHLVERKIGEHLHCRPLVNDGMRREGSETSHDERVLALHMNTRSAIEHPAAHDHGSIVTKVGMAVGAGGALPAHCNK